MNLETNIYIYISIQMMNTMYKKTNNDDSDEEESTNETITVERNKVMFGQVGRSYVYFTYGMHYCLNVVAKKEEDESGAILIRSIQPQQGIKIMIKNRKTNVVSNLTNGPGKLTQAMQITTKQYNVDLTRNSTLFISDGIKPTKILAKPRIGIKVGIDKLWNFSFKI